MRLKPGVDFRNVDGTLWIFLGLVAIEHRMWTGEELVITSLRRPPGDRASWHSPKENEAVRAADFRRYQLDDHEAAEAFCRMLQVRFGRWLGVVLEPDWLTDEQLVERGGILKVDPHVHVQLKTIELPEL